MSQPAQQQSAIIALPDRAAIELAVKIRLLTSCSACRSPLRQTNLAFACSHYLCSACVVKCVGQSTNATHMHGSCPKCQLTGRISRVNYIDDVTIKLGQIRDVLLKMTQSEDDKGSRQSPKAALSKKRKLDTCQSEDRSPAKSGKTKQADAAGATTAGSSILGGFIKKVPLGASPLVAMENANGSCVFAKKSTPLTPVGSPSAAVAGRNAYVAAGHPGTPTGVSGSVVPKKLLKQGLLSPVTLTGSQKQRQQPRTPTAAIRTAALATTSASNSSDCSVSASQETEFSFSGVVTQVQKPPPLQTSLLLQQQQQQQQQQQRQPELVPSRGSPAVEGVTASVAAAPTIVVTWPPQGSLACATCQCHRVAPQAPVVAKRNSGVQVYNSILTLDVSTSMPHKTFIDKEISARPLTAEASTSFDEGTSTTDISHSPNDFRKKSVEVQTERPYVARPKRYWDAATQTERCQAEDAWPKLLEDSSTTLRPQIPSSGPMDRSSAADDKAPTTVATNDAATEVSADKGVIGSDSFPSSIATMNGAHKGPLSSTSEDNNNHHNNSNDHSKRSSCSSTQVSGHNTQHAQPLSLDMSPIKHLQQRQAQQSQKRSTVVNPATIKEDGHTTRADQKRAGIEKEPEGPPPPQDTSITNVHQRLLEPAVNEKPDEDSLGSVEFNTCDFRVPSVAPVGHVPNANPRQPIEADSLDSIPSQMFHKVPTSKRKKKLNHGKQKDTLEMMFRSSEETSIPETQSAVSPIKGAKKSSSTGAAAAAANRSSTISGRRRSALACSPMSSAEESQIILPARKALELSDEEAEDLMANLDTQFPLAAGTGTAAAAAAAAAAASAGNKSIPRKQSKNKSKNQGEQKARRKVANFVMSSDEDEEQVHHEDGAVRRRPCLASGAPVETEDHAGEDDDEDDDPLPMDTEDMRNLEKEIENLDREMEYSKNTMPLRNPH